MIIERPYFNMLRSDARLHTSPGTRRTWADGSPGRVDVWLSHLEAIEVHDLGPRTDEILGKLVLRV